MGEWFTEPGRNNGESMSALNNFQTAQRFLSQEGLAGWLIYDYRGSNPCPGGLSSERSAKSCHACIQL